MSEIVKTTLSLILLALAMSVDAEVLSGYLFVTFRDAPDHSGEQIYFAHSRDGKSWTACSDGKPCLVSEIGAQGVRDPFLLRAQDQQTFYLIATDLSTGIFEPAADISFPFKFRHGSVLALTDIEYHRIESAPATASPPTCAGPAAAAKP
jgi:hypothetical protein